MNHFTPFIGARRGTGFTEGMIFGAVCAALIATVGALAQQLAG